MHDDREVRARSRGCRGRPCRDPNSPPSSGGRPNPAGTEHPQHVAVPEGDRIPIKCEHLGDHAIRPGAHVGSLLAVGAAVRPQAPIGPSLLNLGGGEPLVVAVVPLVEVLADLRQVAEAGELAVSTARRRGLVRTRANARQATGSARARARRLPSSVSGIGPARVAPVGAPLRLAVTRQEKLAHARQA